ncbi:hypothetical protein [Streptomyces sp. NPDC048157]|uniref:hypothetical protein n=1 Tax=Streptomyces sp. NPDC048157 TaxID=3365503 RepID=UPI00371AC038
MTPKLTQLFALVVLVAGFVFLNVRGQDTGTYVAFVGPVVAAIFVASRLDQRTDAQDEVLAKISHQTNGVLTERIQTAVHAALDDREKNSPF